MARSTLCRRVSVCDSIATLNEEGCVKATRLLQNVMGLHNLNQFIIKMFMNVSNNFTIDNLIQLDNQISSLKLSNNNNKSKSKQTSNKIMSKSLDKTIPFPLFRLPIDLISKTSLFLSEKDIFNYEQCCRLFYQMMNNTSYLNQSNTFKTLTITRKRLNEMGQSSYSFFKYSKAETLELVCKYGWPPETQTNDVEKMCQELRQLWDKARRVCHNDGWFDNLLKSIKNVILREDGMFLLDKLPIKLLFDPIASNLNTMNFDAHWDDDGNYLDKYYDKFEEQYLEFKNELEQQGKQIKILKMAQHDTYDTKLIRPAHMLVQHLDAYDPLIDLNNNFLSHKYNPHLKTLTCHWNVTFDIKSTKDIIKRNCDDNDNGDDDIPGMYIKTLRLLHFGQNSSHDILDNQQVIKACNLQNSLQNLLLHIWTHNMKNDILNQWQNVIKSILQKEYFYGLKNVIIMMQVEKNGVDWIFTLLKQNIQLLKYQFKKFVLGIFVKDVSNYYVLEWNASVDDRLLDKIQNICKQKKEVAVDSNPFAQHADPYFCLFNEWLN